MTIKVAISGAGFIANIHAQAVKNQGGKVTAVIEKYTDKGKALANKTGARHYETVEAALEESGFDALIIGTPNFLHKPQAITALQAGVAVMVEKPMAMNSIEAELMLEASQKSRAVLMVAHCWRFDPEVLWLKEQAARLGRIIHTKGYGVHTHWGPSGWFTQQEFAGGGAMADMGIHALDTARFLLGDPRPVSVYAKIGTYYKDFDVDDTGILLVNWDNGAISYLESGWWQPHSDGLEAATQLYGMQGFGQLFPTRLELPDPKQDKLEIIDAGFPFPRQEHCPQSMYDDEMKYFFACVSSGSTPVPGGLEGLTNMRVVDAAYESSRIGKVVDVKQ